MKIFIHIGLHKTGTSFLQKVIFPNLKGINYKIYYKPDIFELQENKINLISCESLSGNPLSSVRFGDLDRKLLIYGLKKMYPNAAIIVGFRHKENWLKSLYANRIKQGNYVRNFNDFYDRFNKEYLDFEGYEKLIKSLFSNVYVYQFEDLKNNPTEFVQNICKFIGVPFPEYKNKIVNKAWKGWKLQVGKLRSVAFIVSRKILERI